MRWHNSIILIISLLACTSGQTNESLAQTSVQTHSQQFGHEIVCFVYHRFGDNRFPSTNISIRDFERHLSYLKTNGYKVLTLSQAVTQLQSPMNGDRFAVITIDDGYKSFIKNGLPLLKKFKFPATLFVNTETVGAGDYLSWDELKECAENNIEIGNHSHSHPYFLNFEKPKLYDFFREELAKSQELIFKNLKVTPKVYAYPYGEFDNEMKTILKSNGFIGAAAQNSGVLNSSTDYFEIPRFPMSEGYAKEFEEKAKMKPLLVAQTSATDHVIGNDTQPLLTITFDSKNIRLDQMQCFIQGSPCSLTWLIKSDSISRLSIKPAKSIANRRRTLYTVTAPDVNNRWHWFSYLWINPDIQ